MLSGESSAAWPNSHCGLQGWAPTFEKYTRINRPQVLGLDYFTLSTRIQMDLLSEVLVLSLDIGGIWHLDNMKNKINCNCLNMDMGNLLWTLRESVSYLWDILNWYDLTRMNQTQLLLLSMERDVCWGQSAQWFRQHIWMGTPSGAGYFPPNKPEGMSAEWHPTLRCQVCVEE